MNMQHYRGAMKEYEQVSARSRIEGAAPERLVQLMLGGALDRISVARGAMVNGQVAIKCERITKAIGLVDGLRASLDHERGGELAGNLEALYEYVGRRLTEANLRNDTAILDEASTLLGEIKQAWDRIVADKEAVQ